MGSSDLAAHAESVLGMKMHESSEDLTLEPVYCLGNCACSPSIRIGDDVHARVDAERFDQLMDID